MNFNRPYRPRAVDIGSTIKPLSVKYAASSPSIIFNNKDFDWSLYEEYWFQLLDCIAVTDGQTFTAEISQDGGGTWKATYQTSSSCQVTGGALGNTGSGTQAEIYLTGGTESQSNSLVTGGLYGWFSVKRPTNNIRYPTGDFDITFFESVNGGSHCFGSWYWPTVGGKVNGVRFKGGDGIQIGTIRAFGFSPVIN